MERLRSQNSLFNSGESRAYRERERERERIHEIEIMILAKIREREDFHQVDRHIAIFLRKGRIAIVTIKATALTMIEIVAQAEKEISDR